MVYFVTAHGRTKTATPIKNTDTLSVYYKANSLLVSVSGRIIGEYPLKATITRTKYAKKVVNSVFNTLLGAIQQVANTSERNVGVFDIDVIANEIINNIISEEQGQ